MLFSNPKLMIMILLLVIARVLRTATARSLLSHEEIEWKCPDWRNYKADHPRLQKHIKDLAAKGLKDPWVRNYAWHFSPKVYMTPWQFAKTRFFATAPYGLGLAILITVGIKGYQQWAENKEEPAHH